MLRKFAATLTALTVLTFALAYTPTRADAGIFFGRGYRGGVAVGVGVGPVYPAYSPVYSSSYYEPTYSYVSPTYVAPTYVAPTYYSTPAYTYGAYGQPYYATPSASLYFGGRGGYYGGYRGWR